MDEKSKKWISRVVIALIIFVIHVVAFGNLIISAILYYQFDKEPYDTWYMMSLIISVNIFALDIAVSCMAFIIFIFRSENCS